ncbi:MAG TPA: L,D-transpeptidase family protein [Dissulfurispiraceae bacterium]|nr:L,D-transpeptidase family protein [Dissulfurispiraceae bacterium]
MFFFIVWLFVMPMMMCGCAHLNEGLEAKTYFKEANDLFSQGSYNASLSKYEQVAAQFPTIADRALFEMGIIYAYSKNEHKDYGKSEECFQKIIKGYPESVYRKDSEMMIFHIKNVSIKDRTIGTQQTQLDSLRKELQSKENDINVLQKKIESLQQGIKSRESEISVLQKEVFMNSKISADKILVEKKDRRLTLFSRGKVLKAYKIALGGNPRGPKEKQGDNKTPEGIYFIDARNNDSNYHMSLHISYPNDRDRQRARELGVSPGGDIMIHGIKNGLSWVGDLQSTTDWTRGCIAVTDDEIEEIVKLVPNGTVVEIKP